jgi:protein-export membrane protein SecD
MKYLKKKMFNKINPKKLLFFIILFSIILACFDYDPLWSKISSSKKWRLGLDLVGGTVLTYSIDLSKVKAEDKTSVINGLRDVIERRVNLFGVSEPKVYTVEEGGENRLVVELAGIKDINEAIKEIGSTPFLEFREVEEQKSQENTSVSTTSFSFSTSSAGEKPSFQFKETPLNGKYVLGAQIVLNSITKEPEINIQFNQEGARIFEELTAKNVGKPLAIFLDGELIEMPIVQEKISGGRAQITGKFTLEEARKFVERFNAGALPAPITLVNEKTVDSAFGIDVLNKAIFAGILGFILVSAFMIIYYKRLGFYAVLALLIYTIFSLAIFKLVPVTMTLAGIAGFILSLGMAVDANILVFERTKEELKLGLSYKNAIEEGFKRAWTSIRDSNISTLISSFVLYYFTSSFVRGFALTLGIGVLVSLFSAITVTRTLLRVFEVREKNVLNQN